MKIVLKGGRILDASQDLDFIGDLIIEDDQIIDIESDVDCSDCDEVYQCKGYWVMPGLIDIHARFNDPGFTHRETISTGTQAAAAGGYTMVGYSPCTNPVIDKPALINHIIDESASPDSGGIYLAPIAMASIGGLHQEIVDLDALKQLGVVAITDDGYPIQDAQFLSKVLRSCSEWDLPFLLDARDEKIAGSGVMHDGAWSSVLGLKGIPALAEEIMVARAALMALHTECQVHVMHISTAGSVQLIRKAKMMGAPISAEVTPYHLILTEDRIGEFDSNYKMMPPLRSPRDRDALLEGLVDGTIDAITSNHTPYANYEVDVPFEDAPFGGIGFETTLASILTHIYRENHLSELELVRKLSYAPANILNLEGSSFMPGETPFAQVCVVDPDVEWTYDVNRSFSKGRNAPFHGEEFKGKCVLTFSGGEVYRDKHFDPTRHVINMQSIMI